MGRGALAGPPAAQFAPLRKHSYPFSACAPAGSTSTSPFPAAHTGE